MEDWRNPNTGFPGCVSAFSFALAKLPYSFPVFVSSLIFHVQFLNSRKSSFNVYRNAASILHTCFMIKLPDNVSQLLYTS